MRQAQYAAVRSHRRGGRRRQRRFMRFVGIPLAAAIVAGGVGVGYTVLARTSCDGQTESSIVASPATAPILSELSKSWAQTAPVVGGRCASVKITAKDSAEMAVALGMAWDPATAGAPPDVWVPQSSAWVRRAAASTVAEPMIPDLQPSIARSPTVIAMPRPMAEALGWPKAQLTWQDLIDKFASNDRGWAAYHRQWGQFRLGMSDPATSTAGLLALTAVLDANDDSEVDSQEQRSVLRLKQLMRVYEQSTEEILTGLREAGGAEQALGYVSAFPALEQDVLAYNKQQPAVPLAAIYPSNGNIEADHPYLILRAPWAQPDRQEVARAFLDYVRGPRGREALLAAGFRDANRRPGQDHTAAYGLTPTLKALPRAVLLPEAVSRTIETWTALTRPTNLLFVLDVSGSMQAEVPGTGKTRLQLAKEATAQSIRLFPDDARIGLWAFSTGQNGGQDYRTVVSLGRLGDPMSGGSRKEVLLSRLGGLRAAGNTGLYDTAAAAHRFMVDNRDDAATNLVVLLTDGRNEDNTGGLNLEQLGRTLRTASPQVPIVTVGYGEDADYAALRQISTHTGGRAFSSREAFDINQVLLTAIFSNT
ncbi:MAG TPA: substrate-binding and VWA domain-containing protein [Pilimelia sp.]|nr:substrate-binding and VWA domain-containing protein [Pilimelia sp.]